MATFKLEGEILTIIQSDKSTAYCTKDAYSILSVSNSRSSIHVSRKGVFSSETIYCGSEKEANGIMAAFNAALSEMQKQQQNTVAEKLEKAIADLEENQANPDFIKEVIWQLQSVCNSIKPKE